MCYPEGGEKAHADPHLLYYTSLHYSRYATERERERVDRNWETKENQLIQMDN